MILIPALAMIADPGYVESLNAWREQQDRSLRSERSWLSVAGLTWLKEGANRLGSNPGNDVLLPANEAPAFVGTLARAGKKVRLEGAEGQRFRVEGKEVTSADLEPDQTRVEVGILQFVVIERGGRLGVRLWNPNSRARTTFKGRQWFAPNEQLVVRAQYTAYPKPKALPITNILGDTAPVENPGFVTFKMGGKTHRLEAETSGQGLFFNFRDLTSGKETYPAGRFLSAAAPKDGVVVLDFNRATNPPCAFTAYATCPLPPRSNWLKVEIRAGELTHHAEPE